MLTLSKSFTAPHRRYVIRTMAFMTVYVAINVIAILGAFDEIIGRSVAWSLALAVAAPIIGQIWATLSLMRESDEFVRALTAKQFIVATGMTMAIATIWGFGEEYAGAAHISAWLIYPVFWACYGVAAPFIRNTNT